MNKNLILAAVGGLALATVAEKCDQKPNLDSPQVEGCRDLVEVMVAIRDLTSREFVKVNEGFPRRIRSTFTLAPRDVKSCVKYSDDTRLYECINLDDTLRNGQRAKLISAKDKEDCKIGQSEVALYDQLGCIRGKIKANPAFSSDKNPWILPYYGPGDYYGAGDLKESGYKIPKEEADKYTTHRNDVNGGTYADTSIPRIEVTDTYQDLGRAFLLPTYTIEFRSHDMIINDDRTPSFEAEKGSIKYRYDDIQVPRSWGGEFLKIKQNNGVYKEFGLRLLANEEEDRTCKEAYETIVKPALNYLRE